MFWDEKTINVIYTKVSDVNYFLPKNIKQKKKNKEKKYSNRSKKIDCGLQM